MGTPKEIAIDGVLYTPKQEPAAKCEGLEYCIVRTMSAGVFAGYVKARSGKEVLVANARRLYYWDGAATLSQLAVDGVAAPQNCKFPTPVDEVILTEAIEIIPVTAKAKKSIDSVPVWKR
ncbi:MAG: hypothetical protein WC455_15620 [Dehalococcoidia bacterium]|jgi:hypothetical protein